jgi:hypothetical protein
MGRPAPEARRPPTWSGAFVVRVTDGFRTRDLRGHSATLYQLSYGHHAPGNLLPGPS